MFIELKIYEIPKKMNRNIL